ncbi:hypothetical protein [Microbacterium sp. SLBN-146]|uniref:hypothetical protein n=1 Tax=Microbacterium sp. SLBN-146 TaxID=2768457 RepID=UPI00114DF23F|nr:hypothetical protein [Microbacterium sp. SLBN-146]TQJ30699.1 hypothetical protein FBY39_1156 [Microbacterium sp. SLBN-146]
MPVVLSHVLARSWSSMPDDVLRCRLMTTGGLPSKSIREGFLLALLQDAGIRIVQKELAGRSTSLIDDRLGDDIVRGLVDHRDRIVQYTRWVEALDAIRDRRVVKAETVHRLARDSERTESGAISAEDRAARARALIADATSDGAVLSAESFQALWRDAAARDDLEAILERAWSERAVTDTVSTMLREYGNFLIACAVDPSADGESRAAADQAADDLWDVILDRPVEFGSADARRHHLSEHVAPRMPPLVQTGAGSNGHGGFFPVDRGISERIDRLLRGAGARMGLGGDARAVAVTVVEASAQPLGLPHDWADKIMAIGQVASSLMTFDPQSPAEDRRFVARLEGGQHRIARSWRLAVARARAIGHLAHTDDAMAFFQSPGDYYAGRLWTRVLRRTLVSQDPPSAREVWDLVYGAFVSARSELTNVAGIVETTSIDSSVPQRRSGAASAPLPGRSAVDDVLQTAIHERGAREVIEFWNAVAQLPPRTLAPADLVAQWEGYVRAERDRHVVATPLAGPDEFSVPFEAARAWLAFRGPLDIPPASGIGEEDAAQRRSEQHPEHRALGVSRDEVADRGWSETA